MDESLIWVSVISGIFGIIMVELMTHNWFRKERFKVEILNIKKINDLEIKKKFKELGLDVKNPPSEGHISNENPGILSSILPEILKNLDPDQIAAIADRFLPAAADTEGGGSSSSDFLMELVKNNPEIVQSFLGGLKGGQKGQGEVSQV